MRNGETETKNANINEVISLIGGCLRLWVMVSRVAQCKGCREFGRTGIALCSWVIWRARWFHFSFPASDLVTSWSRTEDLLLLPRLSIICNAACSSFCCPPLGRSSLRFVVCVSSSVIGQFVSARHTFLVKRESRGLLFKEVFSPPDGRFRLSFWSFSWSTGSTAVRTWNLVGNFLGHLCQFSGLHPAPQPTG